MAEKSNITPDAGQDITEYSAQQLAELAVQYAEDGFTGGVDQMARELARRAEQWDAIESAD